MGNARKIRALSIALLGLILIGAGLSDANAAGCSAEIQKSENGAYAGCVVKMGNREFAVGADASSAEGCSAVCGIISEVGAKRAPTRITRQ